MFSWVAGFKYISECIAGAKITGQVAERMVAERMSSAKPAAALAMIVAVAGATRIRSAPWLRTRYGIFAASWSKMAVKTLFWVRASKVKGAINWVAALVIAYLTCGSLATRYQE